MSVYIIFELMGVFHLFTYPLFDVNLLKFKSEFSEFRGSFGGHPLSTTRGPKVGCYTVCTLHTQAPLTCITKFGILTDHKWANCYGSSSPLHPQGRGLRKVMGAPLQILASPLVSLYTVCLKIRMSSLPQWSLSVSITLVDNILRKLHRVEKI